MKTPIHKSSLFMLWRNGKHMRLISELTLVLDMPGDLRSLPDVGRFNGQGKNSSNVYTYSRIMDPWRLKMLRDVFGATATYSRFPVTGKDCNGKETVYYGDENDVSRFEGLFQGPTIGDLDIEHVKEV